MSYIPPPPGAGVPINVDGMGDGGVFLGISWQQVDSDLNIGWPAASEDKVRAAAGVWRQLAGELEDSQADLRRLTSYVTSDNEGPATDAFGQYMQGYLSTSFKVALGDTPEGERYLNTKGLFPTVTDACNAAARACDGYADKIAETKREIIEKAAEFAAETVVFASLTVISFGTSDAVGIAIGGGIIKAIDGIFSILASAIPELTGPLLDALNALSDIVPVAVRGSLSGGISNLLGTETVDRLFGKDPGNPATLLGEGLGVGMLGEVFGAAGEAGVKQMTNLLGGLMPYVDLQTQGALAQLITALNGSGSEVALAAAKETLAQLVLDGKVNPADIAGNTLGESLINAASDG
jgi:hypothetical protein